MTNASRVLIGIVTVVLLAGIAAPLHAASGAPTPAIYDYRPGVEEAGAGPARPRGSLAPDLTLPTLESYLTPGAPVKTVRLSASRGKKPVVLILTGYT